MCANAISIRWDVPYHDGGSQVTGYWIEKKERNTILWVRENKIPCLECHYKVSTLIEGLEYQFRVYAMNIAGLSKASEPSRPVLALNPVGKFFYFLFFYFYNLHIFNCGLIFIKCYYLHFRSTWHTRSL